MMEELASRHANNGTSQCPLASYRKSNDGGVSLPTCQQRYILVSLLSTEISMTIELAFRHADNSTSQCPLTNYREANDRGVSHPRCQQRYISVSTYLLQISPMTVELAFGHANSGTSQCQLTA